MWLLSHRSIAKEITLPWLSFDEANKINFVRQIYKICNVFLTCRSYNEEDHNLTERKNQKDLSIRMSKFFDHYLKGAPKPVWMEEGIPAARKGKDLGYELIEGEVSN